MLFQVKTRRLFVLPLLAALFCGWTLAQTTSGTIAGTVLDPTGAVVPAASVTLTDEGTKEIRETTGSDSGEFVFAAVRPGTYTVAVEKTGFQTYRRTGWCSPPANGSPSMIFV